MDTRTSRSSRHPDTHDSSIPFRQRKHTSLSDSSYREQLAVVRDSPEKRQFVETSQHLFCALDQVQEAIAVLHAEDASILYSNACFAQTFGDPHRQIPKWNFLDHFECRTLAIALGQARSGLAWTGRSSLKTHAGRQVTFEGTVSPVRNADGAVESVVVRLRDTTLEAKQDRRLRQIQKADALALAGGMAHDFNNLIGAILSAAGLIEMQIEPGSAIHRRLEIIQQAGGRARDLSLQILNLSRRSQEKWTPFDLTGLVTEVTNLLQTTLPENVEVRSDLADGIWVLGDPSQLHQVIMNLSLNGSQAMQPAGGILSIQLQPAATGRRAVDQSSLEPFAMLSLEDTGCGMDPQTLERIFEPFFTTKGIGKGTGLGLSMVDGIVQGHGGSLHVSSELGKGSCFKIRLPVLQDGSEGLHRAST